jgi:Fe-S-cluster containining protein
MHDNDATQRFLDSLPELAPDQEFRFACHPQVPCFNACCGDLNLMLTPYDVLRLRRALGEPSAEFIRTRVHVALAPDTGLPLMRLRMRDDKRRSCPFVSPGGCTVYPHRPSACRTYPLGRATRLGEGGEVLERFFLVREGHCKGFAQDSAFTPATWLADQELAVYNASNDRTMRLMARVKATGRPVDPRHANMAALALYQLDSFANFIRDTGVLGRLDMAPGRAEAVLADEAARLEFAQDWLTLVLFGCCDGLEVRR